MIKEILSFGYNERYDRLEFKMKISDDFFHFKSKEVSKYALDGSIEDGFFYYNTEFGSFGIYASWHHLKGIAMYTEDISSQFTQDEKLDSFGSYNAVIKRIRNKDISLDTLTRATKVFKELTLF